MAATGFVLGNYALLIAGTLVGASGAILTQLMCRAMNRSLFNVLFGASGRAAERRSAGAEGEEQLRDDQRGGRRGADGLRLKSVIIVPGYGMAVAQAQAPVRELMDLLLARGVDVQFAIHPVAGRMPGHMNVLLAEANVPYERLKEMDEINDDFAEGRCGAGHRRQRRRPTRWRATDTASPIYGMPILNVDHAQNIIVLKRGHGSRLRRHRQPAVRRSEDHDAVRRREAVRGGPGRRGEAGLVPAAIGRLLSLRVIRPTNGLQDR